MKKNIGITLISLIITVIVMLILAGVVLNLTIGDNGILKQSKNSAQIYNKEEATETMNMKITGLQIKSYTEKQKLPNLQELADGLCEDEEMEYVLLESKATATLNKVTVGQNQSIFTKIKKYPYEFEINEQLQLASIDGVKIADTPTDMVSKEKYEELQSKYNDLLNSTIPLSEYNSLLEQYNNLNNKQLTFSTENRGQCVIPKGITQAYVIFADSTDVSAVNTDVSGAIIKNKTTVAKNSYVDNYGNYLRCTITIYKLELTGEEGSIYMSVSGGTGEKRAWSTITVY